MIPLKFFVALLAATNSPLNNNGPSSTATTTTTTTTTTILEVCISPGCIADGAEQTLQKLQALAPPDVQVRSGPCSSLCGNGPVVLCPEEKKTVRTRRVKGQKVLDLLVESSNEAPSQELVDGYDLVVQADEAFTKKDYVEAISLYESAIEQCFRPAMDLQAARDQIMKDAKQSSPKEPVGLLWLINARRNEASAKLAVGDVDGALFAAQASCNMSRNTNAESFEVLAEIYQKKGDKADELQSLQDMFRVPVDEKSLPFNVKNRRRELKFRLDKLERELA